MFQTSGFRKWRDPARSSQTWYLFAALFSSGSCEGQKGLVMETGQPWHLVEEPGQEAERAAAAEEPATAATHRWGRIVVHLQRIRFRQRTWGLLGGFLQTFPASLRDRLTKYL